MQWEIKNVCDSLDGNIYLLQWYKLNHNVSEVCLYI